MGGPALPRSSRRSFLLGAVAAGIAGTIAACSDDDGDGSIADGTTGATTGADQGGGGQYSLVKRFPQRIQVPGRVRLPVSLSTGAADFIQDGPAELGAQVTDIDGNAIGERITAVRRDVAPAAYYAFRPVLDDVGFYRLVVEGGPPDGAAFEIADPEFVPVPVPGELLAGFETPTVGDPGGVDPICTRTPEPCPYHSISLAAALNVDRPVAYYVGTPALCSTGSCAPALEAMIEIGDRYADRLVFVHAEVYTDDTATEVTPAVTALGMFYEPALFVTDASGVIVERLDGVWDVTELTEVLDAVAT